MLPFFPKPYDGELLDSVLARFHIRSGNTHSRQTIKQIIGKENVLFSFDIPSRIDTLVNRIKFVSELDSDTIINDHTLFPYYSFYAPSERKARLRQNMKIGNSRQVGSIAGKSSIKRIRQTHYHFCPACFEEMLEKDGEIYWLRIHQTPGLLICPFHDKLLHVSDVEVRKSNSIRSKHPSMMKTSQEINIKKEFLPLYKELAQQILKLYERHLETKVDYWYVKEYRAQMDAHGYVNISRNIQINKLVRDVEKRYPIEFLNQLDLDRVEKWLPRLLYNNLDRVNPLPHLLLSGFFENKGAKTYNRPDKLFGDGPWPCLNPVGDHFQEQTIKEVKTRFEYSSKMPYGVFQCYCGFTYQRLGPEKNYKERFQFQKVVEFGEVWTKKLLEASERYTLSELQKMFGTSDHTIHKVLREHGVIYQAKPTKRGKVLTKPEEYDDIMLEHVIREVESLFQSERRPVQLTMGYLVKRVKRGHMLYMYLDRMPLTSDYLNGRIESREDVEKRIIDWAIKHLKAQHIIINKTQIKRVSGIAKLSENIKQYIEYEFNKLNK